MKEKISFQIGSRAFFGEMKDFTSKDNDRLYIMEGWDVKGNILNLHVKDKDCFFIKDTTKDELIAQTLEANIPLRAGKFLVKDFAEYIGLTIDDLKRLQPLFESMDEKHKYEKVIYDAYVKNNAFELTDEQRMEAFDKYNESKTTTE